MKMLAVLESATLFGIDALPIKVEINVVTGMPVFTIVGLPDAAVQESRERVRAAACIGQGNARPDRCADRPGEQGCRRIDRTGPAAWRPGEGR